jgi:hypothetical protein
MGMPLECISQNHPALALERVEVQGNGAYPLSESEKQSKIGGTKIYSVQNGNS